MSFGINSFSGIRSNMNQQVQANLAAASNHSNPNGLNDAATKIYQQLSLAEVRTFILTQLRTQQMQDDFTLGMGSAAKINISGLSA